jgi:hypothetical protein
LLHHLGDVFHDDVVRPHPDDGVAKGRPGSPSCTRISKRPPVSRSVTGIPARSAESGPTRSPGAWPEATATTAARSRNPRDDWTRN